MDGPSHALNRFQECDAILDPALPRELETFLASGGDPENACITLSNSYEGVPDAISAVWKWSQECAFGDKVLVEALTQVFRQEENIIIPRINERLLEQPESASTIKELIASPSWASFITDTASRHKQTAFYDVVTREAKLPQVGISSDVLRSPQAFVEEIINQFENVLSSEQPFSDARLFKFLNTMSIMCTYDEMTTVVSLRLFAALSRDAEDQNTRALYRRVAQEVRQEAINVMVSSSVVPKPIARQYIIRLQANITAGLSDVTFEKHVLDALVTIGDCGHRRRFDKEITVLMAQYGPLLGVIEDDDSPIIVSDQPAEPSVAEQKVLIQAVCIAEVCLDLVKALYSHSCRTYVDGRPDPRKRRCLCLLLSFSSVFVHLDDPEMERELDSETSRTSLRNSVRQMFDSLIATTSVCEDLLPGSSHAKMKGKAMETLVKGLKHPIIARGIVLWAKECLQGGTDLRSLLKTAPKHLGFLEAVAKLHEHLCDDVLLVIHASFTRDYPGLQPSQVNRLRDMFMKSVSGMLKFSMGPQVVLVFLRLWVESGIARKSHMRNFVAALFKTISPPYSQALAIAMNELLSNDKVLSAIEGDAALSGKVFDFRDETEDALHQVNGVTQA